MSGKTKVVCAGAGVAAFWAWAAYSLASPSGLPMVWEKYRRVSALQEEKADLVRDNELLRQRNRRLADDPEELEKAIRERMNKVRPGDTEFLLEGSPETPAAPGRSVAP